MRISEQFESYRHPDITEDELRTLAEEESLKLNQCKIGYSMLEYKDGNKISFIITERPVYGIFETKVRYSEKQVIGVSLAELYKLEIDWQEVLNECFNDKKVLNKYTDLINKIIWIEPKGIINYTLLTDKLITLTSLFSSIDYEYKQIGNKDKTESRKEIERLYHVTYHLCNMINTYTNTGTINELEILNKELALFRIQLNVDARDGKGKYAELIRFCKNINWNKAGLNKLIQDVIDVMEVR